ncbi:hypothetical protein H8356DRAFT_1363436 [Neocallimastix lanati (nom. inval.)]|nr:hypothetical protein H8356DRAFT_1363436 [Neocallimastix sp. JGI-2020a]
MPIDGIEPPTFALQERRSTTKPNRHFIASDKNWQEQLLCLEKNINSYIGELNRNNIVNPLINPWRFVFSDSNKLTLFITKVFGYRPGNNSSAFNVSTHEGAGTFQALANKELTSPKANWASGL